MTRQRKALVNFWIIFVLFSTLLYLIAIFIYNKRIDQFCNLYAPLLDVIGLLIYEFCQKEAILPAYESIIEGGGEICIGGDWSEGNQYEYAESGKVFTECVNIKEIKDNQIYNNIVKKIGVSIIFSSFVFWLIAGVVNFYV